MPQIGAYHVTCIVLTVMSVLFTMTQAVRKENKCMKHFFVETIQHPTLKCQQKVNMVVNVLYLPAMVVSSLLSDY